jgi:hypothetical protein
MERAMIGVLILLLLLPCVWAAKSRDDFDNDFTRKEEVTVRIRDELSRQWSDINIKYGLIGEGGELIYSGDAKLSEKQFDYYESYETLITEARPTPDVEVRLKFSVGTHMQPVSGEGIMGFFYEFNAGRSDVLSVEPNSLKYYPSHKMFVNPKRYHIYLDDLYDLYGENKIEVIGNRVYIYVPDNGKYHNFDPPIGGDGIPTDCIYTSSDSYNQTNVTTGDDFQMGGKGRWTGLCTNLKLTWQDNTTGSWLRIPSLALDLSCSGATCTQNSASYNVWYYKYPTCEADGQYGVRIESRWKDHEGRSRSSTTGKQEINCGDFDEPEYRNVTLLYPDNATSYDVGDEISFYANSSTTYNNEYIKSMTLQHTVGGTYQDNFTWYPHIPVLPGKNLMTLYFNGTNTSLEGESPHTDTNDSIDLVTDGCFFDSCANCSKEKGRYIYDDIHTLNISAGTICWWMKIYSGFSTTSRWLMSNYPNTNENMYFAWFGSTQKWGFKKEHLNNNYVLYYNPPTNPAANDVIHICISWDDSYTGIFIDGVKEAYSTGYNAPTQKEGIIKFFGNGNVANNCDCLVDELVIYDRRLSDTEIENIYLQSNYTVNFTNQGHIPAGTYDWNVKADTYGNIPTSIYAEHNWTFIILAEEILTPIFVLDEEDIKFSDYLIIGAILVWGFIFFFIYKKHQW